MKRILSLFLILLTVAVVCSCAQNTSAVPDAADVVDILPAETPSPTPSATPAATAEPDPTPEPTPTPTPEFPYYLYAEKGSYTLTIYEMDEFGEYTKVYKTYRISHGGNKTPTGIFTLGEKERWHNFPDGGTVQYATHYHARLYIHSPLYAEENAGKLWPRYYDGDHGIGGSNTGGCLRMVTEASRFIYENCPVGTTLEIVNGSPRNTTSDPVPDRNGKRIDPTDVNMISPAPVTSEEPTAETTPVQNTAQDTLPESTPAADGNSVQ